ncbi:MAG: hypothetical protein JSW34_11395 [Candidatus Zixiibacteriota bacterium]|nr:MAG: hypothetical protein JSW34_11395 [candidate division Zixibacteria bacterium]
MKRFWITYPVIALVASCLWFFTAYVPHHKDSRTTKGALREAESQINDFRQTIAQLPAIIEQRKDLLSRRDDLDSKLYAKEDVLELFAELERQASRWQIEVTEITPPVEELLYLNTIIADSSMPQFLNIGMRLDGDYVSFGRFIQAVEKADYFRGINRCKMIGHADDRTKISLELGFKALLGNLGKEA